VSQAKEPTTNDRVPGQLRIGIDATCLGSDRGYGRILRELLPPLLQDDRTNQYVLFLDHHTATEIDTLPARTVRPATSASQARAASGRGNRSLRDVWTMSRAVARERLNVMYFPSVYSYFPVSGGVPVVVGLTDVIAERHGRIVFPTRRARWLWTAKVALARRQARGIITISEWSRRGLSELFGFPPARIFVAVLAPGSAFEPVHDPAPGREWLRRHGLPEEHPYLIYVGGFNPHKNLLALVDSFAELVFKRRRSSLFLLLVGDYAGDVFYADVEGLRAKIQESGLTDKVRLTGFVPDADLRYLYAGALALVLPSLEEGFGLPAVEAAACGTPCVATRNSPLPELLEGGGIFVDPSEPALLCDALDRLVVDRALRDRLATTALERARKLSWSATAKATRRALEAFAGAGP
jgi:glycosyltransferase involved in cell wall biosynthesis